MTSSLLGTMILSAYCNTKQLIYIAKITYFYSNDEDNIHFRDFNTESKKLHKLGKQSTNVILRDKFEHIATTPTSSTLLITGFGLWGTATWNRRPCLLSMTNKDIQVLKTNKNNEFQNKAI